MRTFYVNEGDPVRLYEQGGIISWYTYDGTAKSGTDYTYGKGRTSGVINTRVNYSTVVNDGIYEGEEYFFVQHSNGTLDKWIINDEADRPRLLTAQATGATEKESSFQFKLDINTVRPAAFAYDINIRTIAGTAIDGQDYVGFNEVIRLEAGQNYASKTITILGDGIKEPGEYFTINVSSSFGNSSTIFNIKDNDAAPVEKKLGDTLGNTALTVATELAYKFRDASVTAGLAYGYEKGDQYLAYLSGLNPGEAHPLAHYYDQIANQQSRFKSYSGALESVSNIAGYWEKASAAIDISTAAYVEYSTTGAIGKATSQQAAEITAALISGAFGEFVTKGSSVWLAGVAVGAGSGIAATALPVLAGLAVGTIAAYGAEKAISFIATQGVDYLYGTQNSNIKLQSVMDTQSASKSSAVFAEGGTVGPLQIGAKPPLAAWRYNEDTKEFSWLDTNKKADFDKIMQHVLPSELNKIDGNALNYINTTDLIGTSKSDIIVRAGKQTFVLGGYGDDVISSGTQKYTSVANAFIDGGAGNDKISGAAGNDVLKGGSGDDTLYVEDGADKLYGEDGDDVFLGLKYVSYTAFSDHKAYINGGAGIDTLDFSGEEKYVKDISDSLSEEFIVLGTLRVGMTNKPYGFSDKSIMQQFSASLETGAVNVGYIVNNLGKYPDYLIRSFEIVDIENIIVPDVYQSIVIGNEKSNRLSADGQYSVINGKDGDDVLVSKGWNIHFLGGAGNDSIFINGRDAFIEGGSGNDRFVFKPDFGSATITDFTAGFNTDDRIDISGFSETKSFSSLLAKTIQVGPDTVIQLSGSDTINLLNVNKSDLSPDDFVDLAILSNSTNASDFNYDGKSDLIWRHDSGIFTEWQSAGRGFTQNVYVDGTVSSDWKIAASSDFNGDGKADILWRHDSGTFSQWQGNGVGFIPNTYVNSSVGTDWKVAGTGDFNGDGKADLLFRHDGGAFSEWHSTGNGFTPNAVYDGSVGKDWHIQALADFNGDGKADILWRGDSGVLTEWQSTGAGFAKNVYVDGSVGKDWHVAGTGDFNGDGKADLLLRSNAGVFTEWQSNGNDFTKNVYIDGSVGNDWQIAQISDFNGDGKSDLLWRNAGAQSLTVWQSNGDGFTPNTYVDHTVGADWKIQAPQYDLI